MPLFLSLCSKVRLPRSGGHFGLRLTFTDPSTVISGVVPLPGSTAVTRQTIGSVGAEALP